MCVRACVRACLRKLEWCGVVWYGVVEWLDVYVHMTVLRLASVTINQTTTQNPSPNVTPTTINPNRSTQPINQSKQGIISVFGLVDVPGQFAPFVSLLITQLLVRNAR